MVRLSYRAPGMKTAYEVKSLSMLELGIEPTSIRMIVHRGSTLSRDMEISDIRDGVYQSHFNRKSAV